MMDGRAPLQMGVAPAERELLAQLARAEPLDEVLHSVVRFIEADPELGACCVSLVDAGAACLRPRASSLPDDVVRTLDGLRIAPDAPSCAAAAFSGERRIVTDIESCANWALHHEPLTKRGFRACWSAPIVSIEGNVLGTVSRYAREPREPSAEECARLDAAAHCVAIALAHARIHDERTALKAHVQDVARLVTLGKLAEGIAHDFNNILTAVSGHTYLGLLDLEEERSTRDSLIGIQEAAERAAEVVKKVATFSRTKDDQPKPVRMAALLADLRPLLRSALPTGVTLDIRCSDEELRVSVATTQIQQVIINLCTHSSGLMQGRGTLIVEVERAPAAPRQPEAPAPRDDNEYVLVTVTDDAPAMERSARERIFDPFDGMRADGGASGFTLYTAGEIVKAHGGSISVDGTRAHGNRFRVYLPELRQARAEPARAAAPAASAAPASPTESQARIIYVDDEEPLVTLAQRWLGRLGYVVTGFTDSKEALQAFRANPHAFDVLISDFTMPGLSGLDLVREVMTIRPDMIVVMSSGYIKSDERERAKALGALDVVLKPQGLAEFGRILHRTLSERKQVPSNRA